MSQKPVLVIMAAGMGSRYGGLKQIDPVDPYGNIIIDFSIFDAREAGFEKVIFIIKKAIENDFKIHIGNRVSKYMDVAYVYQELDKIPEGYQVPEGRVKPWGTGHAVLCCRDLIDGPFAVINADDYYGKEAFHMIYNQLSSVEDTGRYQYTMVGYKLYNTLTDNGYEACAGQMQTAAWWISTNGPGLKSMGIRRYIRRMTAPHGQNFLSPPLFP